MNQTPSSYINKHTLMNITVGNKVMGQRGGQEGLSGLKASVGEPNTRPPLRRGWQGVWEAGDLGTETDGEWATDFSCTMKHTLSCLISFGERIVNTTRTCSKSWAKWGSRVEGLRVCDVVLKELTMLNVLALLLGRALEKSSPSWNSQHVPTRSFWPLSV